MHPEIRTLPWGSTTIKFPKAHFSDAEVQQAADDVVPDFTAPKDHFVGIVRAQAHTLGHLKESDADFQAFHDNEAESIKMVLRQFVDFLSKLYPKKP
jgi:hypothetical protein